MAVIYQRSIYNELVVELLIKPAAGNTMGAAGYFDCGCMCCVVMCGKIYVYFMRVCYKFNISISMPLLEPFCALCLMMIKCYMILLCS